MKRARTPLWISAALILIIMQSFGLACSLTGRVIPGGSTAIPTVVASTRAPASTPTAEAAPEEPAAPPSPAVFQIDESGATIDLEGVFRLEIPEKSVRGAGQVKIEAVQNSEAVSPADPRIPADGMIFEVHMEEAALDAPVRITLPLPQGIDLEAAEVAIYHLVEVEQPSRPSTGKEAPVYRWVPLPSEIGDGTVSAWTDSFSKFTHGLILKNYSALQESIKIDTYYDGEQLTAQLTGQYCTGVSEFRTPDETKVILRVGDFPFDAGIGSGTVTFSDEKDPGMAKYCRHFTADVSGSLGQLIDDPYVLDIHDPSRMTAYVEVQFFHYLADTFRLSGGTLESDKVKVIISKERSRITVTPGKAGPTEIVNISGDQFDPDEAVQLYFGQVNQDLKEIKEAQADAEGHFQSYFYLPVDFPEDGWEYITAVGQSSKKDALAVIELVKPKTPIPDKNGLSASAAPDPVDAGKQVEISGYGFREATKVTAVVTGPGNKTLLEPNELEVDGYGEVHFTLATPLDLPGGKYSVVLTSEIDASLAVSTAFTVNEYNPAQCLQLAPAGGEAALNVVLMETVQEPVYVTIDINDICLKKQPVSAWQVVFMGNASMALYQLAEDGSRLTLALLPNDYSPGTYPVAVGIQYPGKGAPRMIYLEVQVTELAYKSDNYYEAEYEVTYKNGKNDEITDVYQCRRKDEGTSSSTDRYLQVDAAVTCDEGHEDHNHQWYTITDRISGMEIASTCENCYESPGKNPDAVTEIITVGGHDVPAYKTEIPINRTSEVNTDTTQGTWEYEGTRTVWTDSITGMVIGHSQMEKSYFTGTYNGTQITRKDYGRWYSQEYWLIKTSFPLGEVETEGEKPAPEPPPCTTFMPNVKGMDLQAATAALKQLGYQVIWEDVRSQADQIGLITDQKPDPGTCAVPSRTMVLISRNLGPKP